MKTLGLIMSILATISLYGTGNAEGYTRVQLNKDSVITKYENFNKGNVSYYLSYCGILVTWAGKYKCNDNTEFWANVKKIEEYFTYSEHETLIRFCNPLNKVVNTFNILEEAFEGARLKEGE